MENVVGLIKTGCIKEVKAILGRIPGYTLQMLTLNSADFGVPQHRVRIYLIMLREDSLRGTPQECQARVADIVQRCRDNAPLDFSVWLATRGMPIVAVRSAESAKQVICNGCGINKSCETHVCKCVECRRKNPSLKKCKWRASMKLFKDSTAQRQKVRTYLALWKDIKKDSTLKRPPTYFEIAASKKMHVVVNSPRERCLLETLSLGRNLHNKKSILDLSQSISRVAFRCDGLVPTMGTGCGGLFVPSAGVHLSPRQCLALQGVNVDTHDINGITDDALHRLAGNAMTVPVVGAVLWATMCVIAPAV